MSVNKEELVCFQNVTIVGRNKRETPILDIERFVVRQSELVFIKGAPASGKTVLLKTIRAAPLTSDNTVRYPLKHKASTALLVDFSPLLLQEIDVMKNIFISIGRPNIRLRNRAIELIHLFGLEEKMNSKVKALSHSEQLKIELLRAMIMPPSILIIDDYDLFLSRLNTDILTELFSTIIKNDGCVIATGIREVEGFDNYYEIIQLEQRRTLRQLNNIKNNDEG